MIKLIVPNEELQLFVSAHSMALGPVARFPSSETTDTTVDISPVLIEHRGMYGEHEVNHVKYEGNLSFLPDPAPFISSPVVNYPRRTTFQGKIFNDGNGSLPFYSYDNRDAYYNHYAAEFSGGKLIVYNAFCPLTAKDRLYTPIVYEYTLLAAFAPGVLTVPCNLHKTNKGTLLNAGDWYRPRDFDSFKEAVLSAPFLYVTDSATSISVFEYSFKPVFDATYANLLMRKQLQLLLEHPFPPIEEKLYGQLAQDASEKILATDVNVLEFLSDLRKPARMVPKLKNLLKLKTVSANYLTIKYGILPTIDDIQSLIAAFKRHGHSDRNGFRVTSTSRHEQINLSPDIVRTVDRHLKLAVDKEDQIFDMLCQRFESIGLFPSFSNVWDLVPYSFVIDWLVDVGGFLDSVDARQRISRLNVRYVTMSQKTTDKLSVFPSHLFPFHGSIQRVQYHRWVSDQCPVPPLSLQQTVKDFDHWLESSALIIQRSVK